MKKTFYKMIFAAVFIIAMLTSTIEIGSVFATGVGNASQSTFTYTKGTYSSYNDVAILYSPANGQQTGIVKAYDDGTYLHIWVWAFAKPYLGWGEKVATTPSLGVAGMGSDGIWINLNGVIPAQGAGLYNWKVDAGAEKDPQIHSPSYDISAAIGGAAGALAPGGILSAPDVYVATLPMGSQTVFNVALFEHNSPPKEPIPNPAEIETQLYSAATDLPTAGPINVGDSVYDTATVTSTSTSTSSPVTYVCAAGGAHSTSLSMNVAYPKATKGDLIILQVMVRDTTTSLTTPSGFTVLYGPETSGTARQWILYKFATTNPTGSQALSFTGSNTVLKIARMYAFRNVATSSFTESPIFGSNAASNSVLAQSVTSSGSGRLAVSFAFESVDKALPAFTGESGGDWKEPIGEFHCPDGGKGTIQLQDAAMASTGTISGGSAAIGATTAWGVRAFALKPTGSAIIYPTGTVDFQVLPPGGIWTTYDSAVPLISGSAASDNYQVTKTGTYYFRAVYSGDANNLPSQSGDNDEPLTVEQQLAAIGDRVWLDANKNGIQDNGELGVSGVTVELHLCSDHSLLATMLTNSSGLYKFDNLAPGSYYVKFILPTGYAFTLQDQGANNAIDSDANPSTGETICTTLVAGTYDDTWDAGIYVLPPMQLTIIEVVVPASQLYLPTTPVTATFVDNTASYFVATLSNVPSGYAVTNNAYAGWCIDWSAEMERGTPIQVTLYSSLNPPTSLANPEANIIISRANWGAINYVLNNKAGASMIDITVAIWYFTGWEGSDPSVLSSGAQALIASGFAHSGFVPAPGQIAAAICYSG